jgi:hypothetical protein
MVKQRLSTMHAHLLPYHQLKACGWRQHCDSSCHNTFLALPLLFATAAAAEGLYARLSRLCHSPFSVKCATCYQATSFLRATHRMPKRRNEGDIRRSGRNRYCTIGKPAEEDDR